MTEVPKPPSFLKSYAKKKYNEIAAILVELGKWKAGDDIALIALCSQYQRWIEAEKLIKQNNDLCFTTDTGYRQQIPEIAIANNAMKSMLSFIKEFGLTPKERAKIGEVVANNSDDIDPELEDMIVR
ncbi:phage terminase small subunit P27 family [Priestia megaterium]|uniref:phage terminase small subunit P27 family n=1 Tax=Priestia megaterium TaxID=1404 RepID=UPI000BF2595F|nr:phage terminase small subunit P27 family [Priestia megaterium]PFK01966.1 phage terminase small subunit P27 family [Priestia megaterium]PMD08167.1 phage terminase small subunit P27 family [Priestia megaterium]